MKRMLFLLALVAAVLCGCGGTDEGGAGELTPRDQYPVEGIGKNAGQVLANLSFKNPDGSDFSLDADVFKNEHNRVMLLTTTAGWCTACIEEQSKLAALHNEFSGKGLIVVAAMFEDANFDPATVEQVAAWKNEYNLPYTMVLDAPFVLGAYYDPSATPMNMIVDVDTMEILKISTGFDEQVVRAVIEANL